MTKLEELLFSCFGPFLRHLRCPTSDYADLDIIPFWGDIHTAPADEKFPFIKPTISRCGAHCKPDLAFRLRPCTPAARMADICSSPRNRRAIRVYSCPFVVSHCM